MSDDGPSLEFLRRQLAATRRAQIEIQQQSGDGSGQDGGGGMEARIAKLEATVEHIQSDISEIKNDIREHRSTMQTDFRILFGALITVALGLAAIMAHGFHWI